MAKISKATQQQLANRDKIILERPMEEHPERTRSTTSHQPPSDADAQSDREPSDRHHLGPVWCNAEIDDQLGSCRDRTIVTVATWAIFQSAYQVRLLAAVLSKRLRSK